jgi:SAM-dependent methyltransferase
MMPLEGPPGNADNGEEHRQSVADGTPAWSPAGSDDRACYAGAVTTEPDVERALSFGSVAEAYERYRLGYPDELVDAMLGHAGRPVRSALEVGAGTGKATRVVAARDVEVVAVEPDPDMADVLRETTRGLPVEVAVTTFEGFAATGRFDLVYAAAAWHWTDPATRWARAVELLLPGGVLALFGRPGELLDPTLRAAVDAIEQDVLPDSAPAGHPWSVDDMTATEGLVDVREVDLPATVTRTAEEYVSRLGTVSAYLMLPAEARAAAFDRIRAVLPDRVEIDGTVTLSLARRA